MAQSEVEKVYHRPKGLEETVCACVCGVPKAMVQKKRYANLFFMRERVMLRCEVCGCVCVRCVPCDGVCVCVFAVFTLLP